METFNSTVTNAGTISGGGDAILFDVGDDLLVVDPGAVFSGAVDGGGGNNTLGLAAAASVGTITGMGMSFVGFGTVIVDSAASWDFASDDTISNGGTLEVGAGATIGGTITFGGATGDLSTSKTIFRILATIRLLTSVSISQVPEMTPSRCQAPTSPTSPRCKAILRSSKATRSSWRRTATN